MVIKNKWVGYLNRSYSSIKASILNQLRVTVPEMTDYSESNLLIVLVSIFAGTSEMLNYYIDSMARESFLATARKFESVVKLSQLVNYRVRSNISSSVDMTFTLYQSSGETVVISGTPVTIPENTVISTDTGIEFLTLEERQITQGFYNVSIPARQREIVSLYTIGVSSGAASQEFVLPSNYEDGTLYVQIGASTWAYKDHFGFSLPTSEHFTVIIKPDGLPYLLFGDGINGAIPTGGLDVEVAYRTTLGALGNIPAGTITTLVSSISLPAGNVPAISEMKVNNVLDSAGGVNIEDTERLRKSVPLSVRTLDRAVTEQDYEDIAKLAPSVDKAKVFFNCGKSVKIYVAPIGGGVASSAMLSAVDAFMDVRRMITTFLDIQAAGETFIGLDIQATAKFRINTQLAKADIEKVLVEAYSSSNSDINKPVRLSDIYALIDNIERIDFLNLVEVYWVPYARPFNHEIQLDWSRRTLGGFNQKTLWQITYNGTNFQLFKSGSFVATLTIGVPYTYPGFLELTMNSVPAGVVTGDRWIFYTYPINRDLLLDDYTAPRVSPVLDYISITVNEGNG